MTATHTIAPTQPVNDTRQAQRDTQDLVAQLRTQIKGEVRFDSYTKMLYSTDASLYQIQPVGVVTQDSATSRGRR